MTQAIVFTVKSYRLMVDNYSHTAISPGTRGVITLFNEKQENPRRAILVFIDKNENQIPCSLSENQEHIWAYYDISDWDRVVDLVRNEDPVHFIAHLGDRCLIRTDLEPTGESEHLLPPNY